MSYVYITANSTSNRVECPANASSSYSCAVTVTAPTGCEVKGYGYGAIGDYDICRNVSLGVGAQSTSSTLRIMPESGGKYGYTQLLAYFQVWTPSCTSSIVTVPVYVKNTAGYYTVSYNANGGTGAPAAQSKWYSTALALSSTVPTRTGYTFSKWNTNTGGTGTSYQPGGTYTANSNATLYAIWTINTYKLSYDANGGTGAPATQTGDYGSTLYVSAVSPVREGYTFRGWASSASATKAEYYKGASFTVPAKDTTLYAVWQETTYSIY